MSNSEPWRVGNRVPKNVYVGDEIAAQFQREEWAAQAVEAVNGYQKPNEALRALYARGKAMKLAATQAATEMSSEVLNAIHQTVDRVCGDAAPPAEACDAGLQEAVESALGPWTIDDGTTAAWRRCVAEVVDAVRATLAAESSDSPAGSVLVKHDTIYEDWLKNALDAALPARSSSSEGAIGGSPEVAHPITGKRLSVEPLTATKGQDWAICLADVPGKPIIAIGAGAVGGYQRYPEAEREQFEALVAAWNAKLADARPAHDREPWGWVMTPPEMKVETIIRDPEKKAYFESFGDGRTFLTLWTDRQAGDAGVLRDALLNAKGFLDTPISRRRNQGDSFYSETVRSINEALATAPGEADAPAPAGENGQKEELGAKAEELWAWLEAYMADECNLIPEYLDDERPNLVNAIYNTLSEVAGEAPAPARSSGSEEAVALPDDIKFCLERLTSYHDLAGVSIRMGSLRALRDRLAALSATIETREGELDLCYETTSGLRIDLEMRAEELSDVKIERDYHKDMWLSAERTLGAVLETMKKPATSEALEEIIDGIDRDQCDRPEGWWETSTQVEFGKSIANKLRALFATVETQKREAGEEAKRRIKELRRLLHEQNVAIDISREDAVYDACLRALDEPCPVCGGDCSSASVPFMGCPKW